MEIRRAISSGTICSVTNGLVFCAMFTLPWINHIRISTLLFFATVVLALVTKAGTFDTTWYRKQLPFWLWAAYYGLQLVAVCVFPERAYTFADAEQKASLLIVPLSIGILTRYNPTTWRTGIQGFVYGNAVAAAWCLTVAIERYLLNKDSAVFFYHQYCETLGLSAIYFSLYILIAIGYILLNNTSGSTGSQSLLAKAIGLFLFLNLLLLSSKMMITMGVLLVAVLAIRSIHSRKFKITVLSTVAGACTLLVFTINPIKERYANVRLDNYSSLLKKTDFKDYDFDGLSIRLVLWRLANEVINEKGTWFTGTGGRRYREFVNPKMVQYQLYSGNGTAADVGYLNYNMHNQYIESYLQFGVGGVVLLAALLSYTLWQAIIHQHGILIYTIVLFSVAFLTESLLETQAGIILFTTIISGEWVLLQKKKLALASSR